MSRFRSQALRRAETADSASPVLISSRPSPDGLPGILRFFVFHESRCALLFVFSLSMSRSTMTNRAIAKHFYYCFLIEKFRHHCWAAATRTTFRRISDFSFVFDLFSSFSSFTILLLLLRTTIQSWFGKVLNIQVWVSVALDFGKIFNWNLLNWMKNDFRLQMKLKATLIKFSLVAEKLRKSRRRRRRPFCWHYRQESVSR